jgi:hypothetical protein
LRELNGGRVADSLKLESLLVRGVARVIDVKNFLFRFPSEFLIEISDSDLVVDDSIFINMPHSILS